ncbi:hypothetical protein [Haloarcula sp. 1CSR25-25]|uniref:hypothetical protein n=1 Tax=Haloarcula sp. 1CSR25-25 TaxID=2862545 RepID=UPI00289571F3|nr:hypothetical protein [Haloarcula sp. 1CSR25-25]MDT3435597.1 hypothetical protein [Haloarcula sp. 1CSR25-25]
MFIDGDCEHGFDHKDIAPDLHRTAEEFLPRGPATRAFAEGVPAHPLACPAEGASVTARNDGLCFDRLPCQRRWRPEAVVPEEFGA